MGEMRGPEVPEDTHPDGGPDLLDVNKHVSFNINYK